MITTFIQYYLRFCGCIFIVSVLIFILGLCVLKKQRSVPVKKPPYRCLLYIYTALFIIFIYVELQIIIAAFLVIAISLGGFCLELAQYLIADSGRDVSTRNFDFVINCNASKFIECPIGSYIIIILFVVSLVVAIISIQKVIKFIIIHCNLFFDSWKLLSMIVLSEELRTNKIINQLEELSANVNSRNSIGILASILRYVDD